MTKPILGPDLRAQARLPAGFSPAAWQRGLRVVTRSRCVSVVSSSRNRAATATTPGVGRGSGTTPTVTTNTSGVAPTDWQLDSRVGRSTGPRPALPFESRAPSNGLGAPAPGLERIGSQLPLRPLSEPGSKPLVDEKMGGTVHLALGRSYPETGGTNESAVHWDMICDLRRGGRLTADGEPVVVDGAVRQ